MEDTSGGNTAAVAPEDSTPAQQQRRHSTFVGLEHQSPPPPVRTAVKHYIKGTLLRIVPIALLCYLLGWGNFAARDAILEATIGNATLVEAHNGGGDGSSASSGCNAPGVDVLVGVVGTRLGAAALLISIKTPKMGVSYLRRKPARFFIEGVLFSAFGLAFRWSYGLHSLWALWLIYFLGNYHANWWYCGMRWHDEAIKDALIGTGSFTMYYFTIVAYSAVATAENFAPAAEILITGVAYPALALGLKLLMLGTVAKQESKSLEQGENALYEDFARLTEIFLTLPCLFGILRINSTPAFVVAAALSFGCEIGGVVFTMLRHTPHAYKTGSRKIEATVKHISKIGPQRSGIGDQRRSSDALMSELAQKKRRFAVKIANEEWAERLVVATAAPIVFILSSNNLTAQTLTLRTLGLVVAEAGVDTIKTAICHYFGVMVGRVEVRMDVWSAGMCVAAYLTTAWILSVSVVLYKYV